MSIRGSLGVRTSSGASGAAAFELIAPAAGIKGARLINLTVQLAAATASTFGFGRPAAIGITPTSPVTILDENGDNSSVHTKTAVAWGTGPTLPVAFYQRFSFPATVASEWYFAWDKGLFIPAGGSLVLWNLAANGVVDVTVTVDE